ncbi:folate-binding protein YgfZ [Oceanicoccus sp. KOV_DT_Chl]|uniref:CAF17-like 4Fe-4S cluster assembly/insertion protein YgfZ n=1 Tax=Oceanicoccus sp. KOV_DT_Chl TaxID=1904639 RepID=UPI000C7C42D1|nr:hypothetical protein [Oceanicoccus sp. KOV_DT_Chl]
MHYSIVESSKTVLGKYIVFSKAEQQIVSEEHLIIGLYGPGARKNIAQCFGQSFSDKNQCLQTEHGLAVQLDDDGLMFECWLSLASALVLWPQLSQGLATKGSHHWQRLTIQQGIADISSETVDLFIPQMLNYQTTGAISFTKGCYTGQEVVARMQYKGKLKRRLYRIGFDYPSDQTLPAAASELYSDGEQSIGNLVNTVAIGPGQCEALAIITNDAVEKNQVFVGASRHPVQILSLPYAIT